ncbi:MAG: hypothetical protein R3B84_22975 [Zavarzinella sp.]
MKNRYYSLIPVGRETDWYLVAPKDTSGEKINPWIFASGTKYTGDSIHFDVKREGNQSAVTFLMYGYPVISTEVANALNNACGSEIQLIETTITGYGTYYILNVLNVIDCLDHSCVISYYEDNYFLEYRRGLPSFVLKLKIERTKLQQQKIFRVKDWRLPIVVSEEIFQLFKEYHVNGFRIEL